MVSTYTCDWLKIQGIRFRAYQVAHLILSLANFARVTFYGQILMYLQVVICHCAGMRTGTIHYAAVTIGGCIVRLVEWGTWRRCATLGSLALRTI